MTTRGQFALLLAPGLQILGVDWLKEHPEEYSQFLEVETSENAYEEDAQIAGFGLARSKPEGTPFQMDNPIQGATKRYIHEPYGLGWMITREMWDDDRYGIMKKMAPELMKGCRQLWEQIGANVLNNGFSTVTTVDGETFFNTAHPLLGGGTYGNRLSPDASLSVTAMQDALMMYEYMVNERGLKMRISPDTLYIDGSQQFIAKEILDSPFKPYTGNNEKNTLQGRLDVTVLHYLTSQTRWFVGSKESNKAKLIWRKKPMTDVSDDPATLGARHTVYFRLSAGVTHWAGWVGSAP